jgi:O-antigen ligase
MIRLTLLWMFFAVIAITAWKDWYRSLCGLIVLMAVIEHPDMPKSILGIQGLNPWNILLFIIVLAWLSQRRRERLSWDMPNEVNWLLVCYSAIIIVAVLRMIGDLGGLEEYMSRIDEDIPTMGSLVSEHVINAFKWVVPGLLLFDGCRNQKRLRMGMIALMLVYFLLAVQVIRWMPLSGLTSGGELSERSLKILSNEVGYHRVNLSMMLAGAFWAVFSGREFIGGVRARWLFVICFIIFFAQALTGGRMGYATWAIVGFALLWPRWRRYLLLVPVVLCVVQLLAPGVWERMSQGFDSGEQQENRQETDQESAGFIEIGKEQSDGPDIYSVTSGRNIAWPLVIDKIKKSPLIGYGKEAMIRTGLSSYLLEFSESFPHPHNAYLQLLLDNGILGALFVLPFYWLIIQYSYSLIMDGRHPEFIAAGGCCLALVLALLVASFGSQTFYPREGAVGMWCAIGLMLRVNVQRSRLPREMNQSTTKSDELLWGKCI